MKTIEREIVAAAAMPGVKAPPLAKEVIAQFMQVFAGQAARVQPSPPGYAKNEFGNKAEFERLAMLAVTCAKWLAPYQSPTYRAVMIAGDTSNLDQVDMIELTIFSDSGKIIEHISGERPRMGALSRPAKAELVGDDD
jgi:uncharacterized membrane protein